METIVFLIALFGVIYVLIWAIRNEDVDDDAPTGGFLRMIYEEPEADTPDEE